MRSGGMRRESHIWLWLLFIKPKFLPTNTSVLSISCKGKQADCVSGQGREWRSGLRRIRSIRAKCIQVTREEETLTITLKDKCNYFLKSYQQSAGLKQIRDAFLLAMFMTRLPSKMEKKTIRKIGMRPMSLVSSSTHGADIRSVSTRDAFTHVRKYPADPEGGPATTRSCWQWKAGHWQQTKLTNYLYQELYWYTSN